MRRPSISIALAARRDERPRAATRGRAHAGDELVHRERLHEVVVRAELERAHAVQLAAARAHDDDRYADAFLARGLDHAPAVELGKHQVEHADVGAARSAAARAPSCRSPTQTGSKPAARRWRAMPSAMTSSSSTIRTFGIDWIIVTPARRMGWQLVTIL